MLGSAQDAEDALQDALTNAWRALPALRGAQLAALVALHDRDQRLPEADRAPPAARAADRLRPGADPHDGAAEPLVESVWVEPYPDARLGLDGRRRPEARYEQRESVELAFVAALQHLPPRQRAVLILRDVLGFSGAEVAEALDTTPASVYSALQRAHKAIDERLPAAEPAGDAARARRRAAARAGRPLRAGVGGRRRRRASSRCSPRTPRSRCRRARPGSAAATRSPRFLREFPLDGEHRSRLVPVAANGQLAFGHYFWEDAAGGFVAHGINLVTLRGGEIADTTTYLTPEAFPRFELPRLRALSEVSG